MELSAFHSLTPALIHKLIDAYLAQSIDKGISFLKNIRVTTQSWDPGVDAPVDGNGLQSSVITRGYPAMITLSIRSGMILELAARKSLRRPFQMQSCREVDGYRTYRATWSGA
jgi:hypothetical protein